jgi:hypothetical protein
MKERAEGDVPCARKARTLRRCSVDARSGERPRQPTMCAKFFRVETGKKMK